MLTNVDMAMLGAVAGIGSALHAAGVNVAANGWKDISKSEEIELGAVMKIAAPGIIYGTFAKCYTDALLAGHPLIQNLSGSQYILAGATMFATAGLIVNIGRSLFAEKKSV